MLKHNLRIHDALESRQSTRLKLSPGFFRENAPQRSLNCCECDFSNYAKTQRTAFRHERDIETTPEKPRDERHRLYASIQAGRAGRRRRIREIAAFLVVTLCLTPLLVALVSLLATASR